MNSFTSPLKNVTEATYKLKEITIKKNPDDNRQGSKPKCKSIKYSQRNHSPYHP